MALLAEIVTCWACGAQAAVGLESGGRRRLHRCLDCSGGRRERWLVRAGAVLTLLFLLSLMVAARGQGRSTWEAILAVTLGPVTFLAILLCLHVAAVVVHEAGHALVGKALGFRIFAVRIGIGRLLRRFRLGPFPLELYSVPLGGEVVTHTPIRRLYRTRRFLHVLAGPFASASVAWLAQRYRWPDGSGLEAARSLFVLLNVFVCAASLLPARGYLRSAGRREPRVSDGLQLLTIPRVSPAAVDGTVRSYHLYEAVALGERGEYEGALGSATQALEDGMPASQVLPVKAWALIALGRCAEAREDLLPLLQDADLDATTRATAANDVAWASVLAGDAPLLEEADRLSAEAVAADPSSAAFVGTRGAVLVALGRLDEGIESLVRSFSGAVARLDRALTHAWLAIGEAGRGDLDAAARHLDAARRVDAACVMLTRAEAALRSAAAAPGR